MYNYILKSKEYVVIYLTGGEKIEGSIAANFKLSDDDEKIINGLRNCLTYKIKAVTLIVNDKEIAVFKNGKQFNEVLNILRHSKYEDSEIYDFYNSKKDRDLKRKEQRKNKSTYYFRKVTSACCLEKQK